MIILSTNKGTLTSFPMCIPFFFLFLYWRNTFSVTQDINRGFLFFTPFSIMLKRSDKSRNPVFLCWREWAQHFIIKYDVGCWIFIDVLCQIKKLFSILNFLRVFIISKLLIFSLFCSSTVAGSAIDIYQIRVTYHRRRQQIKKVFFQ
uniref:Uncharacterized protein n=1 Tax=Pipistrellus kuhlii TaxID=59472 RepID=A0A7J7VN07_PIPKU|nr:hypothetical protein mPipKuh1_008438 [Pipistrellus kuhlii]